MTGPLVPTIIWPGSGSNPIGRTPFGLFDNDEEFVDDAPKVAKWVCNTLGYPIMSIELTDVIIYSQFEQAVTEFSSQVNEFNMREQMIAMQGISTSTNISQTLIKSSPLPYIIEISQMYGTEVGVGGYVDFHKGYIILKDGVQDYDLQPLWAAVSESGNRIEVRRIWNERAPAMNRFFDPFAGGAGMGIGFQNLLGEFGWGSYSVASQYLLMPIYETLLRVQAIELNDLVRRSQYGFELKNNRLKVIPIPTGADVGTKLWFEYTVTKEKFASQIGGPGASSISGSSGLETTGVASDYSNVPFDDIMYSNINDVGKRWIRKYTLALCKIVLGRILSKYESIPVPNSEVRLDGTTLRQEGQQEIDKLLEQLRETLEQTGKAKQMEKASQNETHTNEIMKFVPTAIYIY